MKGLRSLVCVAAVVWPLAVFSQGDSQLEVPRGLWETELDASGIRFHVRTKRCGRALCGRVERVKNRRGYDAPSNAVSAQVLVQMRPQPDGSFFGEARDTTARSFPQSRVVLRGDSLIVRFCQGDTCKEQAWKRLR
ncbi:MAG: hypothetical protein AAGF32_09190 [Pseudomonadota bacterium]